MKKPIPRKRRIRNSQPVLKPEQVLIRGALDADSAKIVAEIEALGVDLLAELAKLHPDIHAKLNANPAAAARLIGEFAFIQRAQQKALSPRKPRRRR